QRSAVRSYLRQNAQISGVVSGSSHDPLEIASRYNFPAGDGKGQVIALLEFGGGYISEQIAAYFFRTAIPRTGQLEPVILPGGGNILDNNPLGGDGEVQMDIEIAGSLAPAADILVHFAPPSAAGFYSAVHKAIQDKRASVIAISWGFPENEWN